MGKSAVTSDIRHHWNRVASLGCLISSRTRPTLHHVHGGSCPEAGIHKGMGQRTSHWLVIPLAAEFHSLPPFGIDAGVMSVVEWEDRFGTQVGMLDEVSARLGYDVMAKAGLR
jgi:hypothetical protein